MAMQAKLIDVTQSLLITDPNSFLSNLRYVTEEDKPEKADPIIAFECYNVLPTSYGYRSYFGDNAHLDIVALSSRCDRIFLFQLDNLKNILIALCEDGLWYSSSTTISASAWTQGITLSVPTPGIYKEWTYCIIENKLYVYREGEASYWTMEASDYSIASDLVTLNITSVVPSFLNMAGQIGIFRANTSLGFWDSANSIAWSSPLDTADFTPSLTTLAGNAIFSGILGKIVIVRSQGNNFIVYTTKGIVGIRYVNSTTFIWETSTISDTAGISSSKEVTTSITEMEHYAYTNTGIKKIGNYNALTKVHTFEEVFTDIYDLIRENSPTVYLEFLNGRYLLISLIEDDYISGRVSTIRDIVSTSAVNIMVDGVPYDGLFQLPSLVGGTPLVEDIRNQLERAPNGTVTYTSGMYLEWSGSGVGSFSGVTTPMHYFDLDHDDNYVPHSSDELGPLFDASGFDANSAPLTAFVVAATPTYPLDYKQLGYVAYTPLSAGVAQLGVVDAKLSTFISAQIAEWNNFIVIQTNNKTEIQNIPNSSPANYPSVGGPYYTAAVADAAVTKMAAAFAASKPGSILSGNTVTYLDWDVGSFLSGEGETEPAVLSGVGTNAAFYSLTRNFSGGYNVKRWATRTYSKRLTGTELVWSADMTVAVGFGHIPEGTTRLYGLTKEDVFYQFPSAVAFNPVYTSGLIVFDQLTYFPSDYTFPTSAFMRYMRYRYNGVDQGLPQYAGSINRPNTLPPSSGAGYYQTTENAYSIDYNEIKHITVEDDPSIVGSATLNAYQHNLDWGTALTNSDPNEDYPLTDTTGQLLIPGFDIAGGVLAGGDFGYTYPGADYLLQDGVPSPIYPTYVGALVYDTALKKWGKMVHEYTALLDYNIYNGANNNKAISFSDFGIDMAILKDTGVIYNMDVKPAESYLLYGKIGASRRGMSTLYEVRASFRLPSTCTLSSYSSLTGVVLDLGSYSFNDVTLALSNNLFIKREGKYHVVKVEGIFDLDYLEVRLNHSGNR